MLGARPALAQTSRQTPAGNPPEASRRKQAEASPGRTPSPAANASSDSADLKTETPAASIPDASYSAPALARYEGLQVHDIQIRGENLDLDDQAFLRPLLVQQSNEPLNKIKLRRSIQALYDTGRFSDIQVEADRRPDAQVSLVFVAKENYFIGTLTVEGAPKAPPTRNQLIDSSKLQLGELFTRAKLQAGIDRMKRLLADNGYYQASITTQLAQMRAEQQANIMFVITAGPVAHLGNMVIQGNASYPEEEIREIAKLHTGDRVDTSERTRALERLRKKYQKNGRLEAQVSITQSMYHPQTNTVDYVLNLQRGPTVDVHIEGAKLSQGLIKKYIPIYQENAVDLDLLNEGSRNLRDYFQTKGYFDATVSFSQQNEPSKDHRSVIYDVNKGKRHKLIAVVLQGNHYFNAEQLRERLNMEPANTFLAHGHYSQSILSSDVQSIQNLYRSNGFQQVKVTANVQDDYQGVLGRLRVVLRIDEGPQTLVQNLTIAGNHAVPITEILQKVDETTGQPFSVSNIATDRESVLNFYFNHGFPNAQFDASYQPASSNPPRMNLTYNLQEGEQVIVDHVYISGLHYTRPYVVTREIQVHPGDPVSQSDILDTQRRLYDLGIFNEADIAVQNPDGLAREKNVLLNVEEAKRYTFNYGVGFEVQTGSAPGRAPQGGTEVSPRVLFDISRINFLGRDHTLTFASRYGRLEQRALFSYEAPRWLGAENWKLILTTFYDKSSDVRTFTAQRLEASVEAEQRISRITTFLYRFSYRRVKVDPRTLAIDPNLIPLLSQPVRVGMPSFSFLRDKRDDPLDARKGNYTTFDFGVSSGIFGSEASFSRALAVNSTYHELPRSKIVFARNTRIGFEEPFNNTVVPLAERFFAGGADSNRGFALNQAGPRDLLTGFPLGGNALFLNQLELRFAPFTLPYVNNNLSAVVFHDMGNVFTNASEIFSSFLRVTQRNKQFCEQTTGTAPCDFNYMSQAVGGGLRYRTPIGPVRVDVGYNLNPPAFPVSDQNRFETLRHFNFFFSLGQTF